MPTCHSDSHFTGYRNPSQQLSIFLGKSIFDENFDKHCIAKKALDFNYILSANIEPVEHTLQTGVQVTTIRLKTITKCSKSIGRDHINRYEYICSVFYQDEQYIGIPGEMKIDVVTEFQSRKNIFGQLLSIATPCMYVENGNTQNLKSFSKLFVWNTNTVVNFEDIRRGY